MEQKERGGKRKVVAGFFLFLGFLVVCTLVTRGIYAAGIVKVMVTNPEQKNITHDYSLQSSITAGQEMGIYVPEGLRVETVSCKVGDSVTAGDMLFRVRMEDLEQAISQIQADIHVSETRQSDIARSRKQAEADSQEAAARLEEDYNSLVREHDIVIEQKRLAYRQAVLRRTEAENAAAAADAAATVSGGDAARERVSGNEIEILKLAESAAAWEAEAAALEKEKALRQWERQLADARKNPYEARTEEVQLQEERKQRERELAVLQALYDGDGWVCARETGILTDCQVHTGEYTQSTAVIHYTVDDGTGVAFFGLDEETEKYITVGDNVDLEYRTALGENKQERGVVEYLEDQGGMLRARVAIRSADLVPGLGITMRYHAVSKSYATVIPTAALLEENGGNTYVLVVEEETGFFGKEYRVRKVNVTVLEQNENSVAIESPLISKESQVVVYGGDLEGGETVRLLEP